ncbi:hypothetical protein BSK59_13805 [Paenibacillus odorifer]|uniref:hypothetical protein n=1 Tax=Paenibacillus odorifer TaxID=189426 RepID=UPI00096C57CB|nr:hypothetical protein [Paenibacillus odorifer]OME55546.1 hypothetical protein BSK59_13805 [Paenibacillus odorifer]
MTKFYAFAINNDGKTEVINFEDMGTKVPKYLAQAEQIAKEYATKNGLVFKSAHVENNTLKGGKTLTKFKKLRSQTGSNGKNFAKAL